MKVAGIDYGRARVGVAVSDDLGLLAHPREHVPAASLKFVLTTLARLAQEESLEGFVVGLPRMLNGREGASARRARRFAGLLERATGLPVTLVDEWLSTKEAQGRLHESGLNTKDSRAKIDSASAAVILQSWLAAQGQRDGG